jgi:hypothetical protein
MSRVSLSLPDSLQASEPIDRAEEVEHFIEAEEID